VAWIELDGAVNVRDLGGLPTENGGKTVAGRLLRAENLQELSPADVATLVGEIGLTTVVDLRSSDELALEGPAPLDSVAGVLHVHHPVLPEAGSATDADVDVLLTRADRDRSRYPADPICGHYLGYLEDRPDQVAAAVRSIARSQGAALVHCAAGKDRTGVVVAVSGSDRSWPACAGHRHTRATSAASPTSCSGRGRRRWRPSWSRWPPATAGPSRGWPVTASAAMTCSCSTPGCSAPDTPAHGRSRQAGGPEGSAGHGPSTS
jgi:hypothetical protein